MDKKLADFSATLDIPARFTALQNAVDALRCQQHVLAQDMQQRNQKPPVTLCHVPTQVSPPPAPPMRVSAGAQVSSPMLAGLCTRVSAGTQMTPQNLHTLNQQHAGRAVTHHAAPQVEQTGNNGTGKDHGHAPVYCGMHHSPAGADGTAEQPDRRVNGQVGEVSGDGMEQQAEGKGARQRLSSCTNKYMNQGKPPVIDSPPRFGKENVREKRTVPVRTCRPSKQKRAEQVYHEQSFSQAFAFVNQFRLQGMKEVVAYTNHSSTPQRVTACVHYCIVCQRLRLPWFVGVNTVIMVYTMECYAFCIAGIREHAFCRWFLGMLVDAKCFRTAHHHQLQLAPTWMRFITHMKHAWRQHCLIQSGPHCRQ